MRLLLFALAVVPPIAFSAEHDAPATQPVKEAPKTAASLLGPLHGPAPLKMLEAAQKAEGLIPKAPTTCPAKPAPTKATEPAETPLIPVDTSTPMDNMRRASRQFSFLLGRDVAKALDGYEKIILRQGEAKSIQAGNIAYVNHGIINHSAHLLKARPELIDQIPRLYARTGVVARVPAGEPPLANETIGTRTILHPTTGERLKAGWYWDEALKASGGDPVSAMRLIGICSHDQAAVLPLEIANTVSCGSDARFLSGSLGEGVDAPTRITDLVMQKYSPQTYPALRPDEMFQRRLPRSKYYHVAGAAYVACEMIADGHDPNLIVSLQTMLGWGYRHQVFTQNVCGKTWNHLGFVGADLHGLVLTDPEFSPTRLLISGFFHKDKKGHPYSDEWMNKVLDYYSDAWTQDVSSKPASMTAENYSKYRKVYQMMVIDYLWTMKQHQAGAKFAAEKCAPVKAKK